MSDQRLSKFSISSLIFSFGFLYVPIMILIVYSFNDSRLVTVWSGFSFKSYFELFQDQQILDAGWLSLEIAFLCACMSLILDLRAPRKFISSFREFFLCNDQFFMGLQQPDCLLTDSRKRRSRYADRTPFCWSGCESVFTCGCFAFRNPSLIERQKRTSSSR